MGSPSETGQLAGAPTEAQVATYLFQNPPQPPSQDLVGSIWAFIFNLVPFPASGPPGRILVSRVVVPWLP